MPSGSTSGSNWPADLAASGNRDAQRVFSGNGFTAVTGDVVLVRRQLDTLRSAAMFRKLKKYITPLLAAGAAVVAVDGN